MIFTCSKSTFVPRDDDFVVVVGIVFSAQRAIGTTFLLAKFVVMDLVEAHAHANRLCPRRGAIFVVLIMRIDESMAIEL